MNNTPISKYDDIKALADNPMAMASRIVGLEQRAAEWKIGTEPQRMDGLIIRLKSLADKSQSTNEAISEQAHSEADDLLLAFINNEEVSRIYGTIQRWFG